MALPSRTVSTHAEKGGGPGEQSASVADRVLDAHTHLSGSQSGEDAASIAGTLDEAGVDKAFVFAPLLDTRRRP